MNKRKKKKALSKSANLKKPNFVGWAGMENYTGPTAIRGDCSCLCVRGKNKNDS